MSQSIQNKIKDACFGGIYCSIVAWWTSSVTECAQVFISCCSSGGSCKQLPGYRTVVASNGFSEPELSKDRVKRDEVPPDEKRRRKLEANVVSASPDLWRTLSPPLADRRRMAAAALPSTSADMWRRRCRSTSSTLRQTNTGQGACRMISSLIAPSTVRFSALELPRVPMTTYEAFSSCAIRHTTSPGLPGQERSLADTFNKNDKNCLFTLPTNFTKTW